MGHAVSRRTRTPKVPTLRWNPPDRRHRGFLWCGEIRPASPRRLATLLDHLETFLDPGLLLLHRRPGFTAGAAPAPLAGRFLFAPALHCGSYFVAPVLRPVPPQSSRPAC